MRRAWQKALTGFAVGLSLSAWSEPLSTRAFNSESSNILASPQETNRKWGGEWYLGTAIQNFSEGKDEGTGTSFKAGLLLNYEMTRWSRFHIDSEIKFYGSRVQVRYEDEDVMKTNMKLREGYLGFGLEDGFEVRIGALAQKDIKSDLLISSRRAFPGLREGLQLRGGYASVNVWAQQSIPTSYSMNVMRADREPTPTFITETASLKITPAKMFEAEFNATHFRFNHLPAVVAFESSSLGNSVDGDVAANSDFKYDFDGFLIGTSACACDVGPLKFRAGGQWLQNTSAPQGSNRGQLLFLESELTVKDVSVTPRYSVFFNESDSSPAYYNRWDIGNNNRKGSIAQLSVDFRNFGFKVDVEYIQAAMINDDPFQFDKQVFSIGLETTHVPF